MTSPGVDWSLQNIEFVWVADPFETLICRGKAQQDGLASGGCGPTHLDIAQRDLGPANTCGDKNRSSSSTAALGAGVGVNASTGSVPLRSPET